ncbi:unnamed protein product [Mesocestoides corti]|uniref:DUF5733 domain-containing protein n=1 Tax=Mesocestoides corti TaxID=53468 RepID=A0A0R3UH76_MESCO|nr:unnamed protein product [Mesocestoides corti]
MTKDKKETMEKKKRDKKSNKEKSGKKKDISADAAPTTGECILLKKIRDKKRKEYSEEEVKKIYNSTAQSQADVSAYEAFIYPNKVKFKPLSKAKKLKSIYYTNIAQMVPTPENKCSFLLYVPKSKKVKQFTGLFTWRDPQICNIFQKAVFEVNPEAFKCTDRVSNNAEPKIQKTHPSDNRQISRGSPSEDEPWRNPQFHSSRFSSLSTTKESGLNGVKTMKGMSVTYTHYCPRRCYYQDGETKFNFHLETSSTSACSSDSYDDKDSDGPDFICRDKSSVFYGERMSPRSQYIDRVVRETMQVMN